MSSADRLSARISMVIAHMAGMIDLPSLPLWVGVLASGYLFSSAQAGACATVFLTGAVVASVALSPFFHRLPGRWIPALGFGVSAVMFLVMTQISGFGPLLVIHFLAGMATGLALSFSDGTMSQTANPHRIFGMGGLALGLFAIAFLGATPQIIASFGPRALFYVFAGTMAFACIVTAAFFPSVSVKENLVADAGKFSLTAWLVIGGIMSMALLNAMVSSFIERMGVARGMSIHEIQAALIAGGVVAVITAILATTLQKRFTPLKVGIGASILQIVAALLISWSNGSAPLFAAAMLLPFAIIFAHTFVFGYLARIEPAGRANAATPAILMTGAAVGPLLGGLLVDHAGYASLGVAAILQGVVAMAFYFAAGRRVAPRQATATT